MAIISTLILGVDTSQVTNAINQLNRLSSAGNGAGGPINNLSTSTRGLAGAIGLAARAVSLLALAKLAKDALDAADSFALMKARIALVTVGTQQLAATQANLFKIAQDSRTSIEGVVGLYTDLSRATESLGVTQTELYHVVSTVNKAFAISGTGAQQAKAAILQLGQAFASGTLAGDELKSVLENAPRLAVAIADGLGVTVGKLRQLGSEGKLTSEQIFNAIRKSAGVIEDEFGKIPVTLGSALTQVTNSITNLVGTIDQLTGTSSTIGRWVSESSSYIDKLTDSIQSAGGVWNSFIRNQERADAGAKAFIAGARVDKLIVEYEDLTNKVNGLKEAQLLNTDITKQGSEAVAEDILRLSARKDAIGEQIKALQNLSMAQSEILKGTSDKSAIVPMDMAENQRFEQAKKTNVRDSQRAGALAKFMKDNATATEKFNEALKKAKEDLGELFNPEVEARLRKTFLSGETLDFAEINVNKIQRDLQTVLDSYKNSESILEANHSANIIRDREYYAQKTLLVRQNAQAEIDSLNAQNAQLTRNKPFASAKDISDNQQKIADNKAKIVQLMQDAGAKITVLGIQEQDTANKIKIGYDEAEASAFNYLQSLKAVQQQELAGAGRGAQERERLQGRQQIQDKYTQQLQQLESERRTKQLPQDQYTNELERIMRFRKQALAEYDAYYARRLEQEQSFTLGATEAMNNYLDAAANTAKQTEELFSNAFKGAEDTLTKFLMTGKLDFRSFANAIIADLARIQARQILSQGISSVFGALFSTPVGAGAPGSSTAAMGGNNPSAYVAGGRAIGGPVSSGGIYRVNENGPELLNMAGKQYLMTGSQGGSVSPAGVNVTSNPIIHIDSRTDQAQVAAMVRAGVNQGNADLVERLRRGRAI